MDINQLRSLVTVLAFVAFLGILLWAYKPSRKKQFDDAALLPFKSE
jgi:cytochrome c oxidase cbb3-type subunit IV